MKKIGNIIAVGRRVAPRLWRLFIAGIYTTLGISLWLWYQAWPVSARGLLVLALLALAAVVICRLRDTSHDGRISIIWILVVHAPAALAYYGVVLGIGRESEILPIYIVVPSVIVALLTLPVWLYAVWVFTVTPSRSSRLTTSEPEVLSGFEWLMKQLPGRR